MARSTICSSLLGLFWVSVCSGEAGKKRIQCVESSMNDDSVVHLENKE